MEAASRSLEEITEEVLISLINKIVKKSIIRTLMLTRHSRIKYPELKQEKLRFYLESQLANKSV
ncbi:MAG: hypothetical protein KR126chlam6_00760 [Candidatus Anoxychlamydiales bacterium]|nr:hypothetical protein [Candidatus Anoxychlamydiales bacterium]